LDARARLSELDPQPAAVCMRVNNLGPRAAPERRSHLPHECLLGTPCDGAALQRRRWRIDTGDPGIRGSQTAAEEAFRHASADATPPGIALLIARLPDIVIPMRAAAPGPAPRTGGPPLILAEAAAAIAFFLTTKHKMNSMEVWHA
jgi:hypothetical protein